MERENRDIKNILMKVIQEDASGIQPDDQEDGTTWAVYLPQLIAIRNASPRRLLGGQTPHFMMFGQHSPVTIAAAAGAPLMAVSPELHTTLLVQAAELQRKMKEKQVEARILKRPPTVFEVGDRVFVTRPPAASIR